MNLFKRALLFTDIHLGLKSNSIVHNEDCLAFVHWAVKLAKEKDCDTCFFLGDFHNNRASINILTLNYSLKCLEHLNDNFRTVFFIPGNHDLYYRDKRDVQSVEWARHLPNIQLCNDWFVSGDVVVAPWLVGDDYKRIPKLRAKYMFGHFELPGYLMNAMIAMPEHGELRQEHFGNFDHVFTGHFHKRQTGKNITYIGNCFPHNYADAGDDARGVAILDWSGEIEYHAWPDQPIYRVYKLSDVIHRTDELLRPKMHCRINIDVPISYEEATFIKETFVRTYNLRELYLLPQKEQETFDELQVGSVEFQSVDQIVTSQLTDIQSEQFDKRLLLDIYNTL